MTGLNVVVAVYLVLVILLGIAAFLINEAGKAERRRAREGQGPWRL